MNLPRTSSYEVKTARTQHLIPIVNGVHLHSIYNPTKEAETLLSIYSEQLKNKNEVLILGLGFAYHVNAIVEKLTELHGEDFKIVVIEPNAQVYQECINLGLLDEKKVTVYQALGPEEIYRDLDFIHFLLRKPATIAHPPSFNLYQQYFKTILTFNAPKDIGSILNFVKTEEIKKYLRNFDSQEDLENILYQSIPRKPTLSENDFLAMALVEMTQKSHLATLEKGES